MDKDTEKAMRKVVRGEVHLLTKKEKLLVDKEFNDLHSFIDNTQVDSLPLEEE